MLRRCSHRPSSLRLTGTACSHSLSLKPRLNSAQNRPVSILYLFNFRKPFVRNHHALFPVAIGREHEVFATGSRATIAVPVALELISTFPPSCAILSCIPLIPIPDDFPDAAFDRFSGGIPLP